MRAAVGILTLALVACGAAVGADRRASLRLVDRSPVTLAGSGFAAGERVRVTISVRGRTTKRVVVATRAGGFRTTFPRSDATCAELEVRAAGDRGSRSGFRLLPPPGCDEDV